MWALYNSYHYDCLDRYKKQNANDHSKKETENLNHHKYEDIYCHGTRLKK